MKSLDDAKIEDAFYRDLAFGTGGLRGVIGAGTNRMNIYTVAKASQGLADYLQKNFAEPSVAIGYDSRIAMSEELEREVLEVCNLSQGVRQEGIEIGEIRMLVQLVREGDLSLERAATKAKMTVEQFKKVMEDTPLQAV